MIKESLYMGVLALIYWQESYFNEVKLTGKYTFLQGPPHLINTSPVEFLHSGEHALNNPHFSC